MARNMKKTRDDIVEQIKLLEKSLKDFDEKRGQEIGKLAIKAGLTRFNVPDEEIEHSFRDLAERFETKNPTGSGRTGKDKNAIEKASS